MVSPTFALANLYKVFTGEALRKFLMYIYNNQSNFVYVKCRRLSGLVKFVIDWFQISVTN